MRHIYALLLLIFLPFLLIGQYSSPYALRGKTDVPMLSIGLTMNVGTVLLDKRISPFTDADLSVLVIDKIFPIDRYSTRHFSTQSAKFSDYTVLAAFAMPFTFLVDEPGRQSFNEYSLITLEGALINAGIIGITKVLVRRPRPYLFNPDVPLEFKLRDRKSRYSFFSGHVATSSYFSFVTAKLYSDLYPDSHAKGLVWGTAAIIPAMTAYGRMRAGRHYFTDVLAGYMIGAAVGIIVPELHKL